MALLNTGKTNHMLNDTELFVIFSLKPVNSSRKRLKLPGRNIFLVIQRKGTVHLKAGDRSIYI